MTQIWLQGTAAINLASLDQATANAVRAELTLTKRGYNEPDESIAFWIDYRDGWLHVPKGWLLSHAPWLLANATIHDQRSDGFPLPPGTWPRVTFGAPPHPSGQPKAIEEAVTNATFNGHGGLFLAPTRSGKSLMALAAACKLGGSTLIIVDDTELLKQFVRDVGDHLGMECGVIQGGTFDWRKPFVVAMAQTLINRQLPNEVRRAFRTVIVDECQSAPCKRMWTALSRIHSRYVLGLSATPDRKDGLGVAIRWIIGPTVTNLHRKLDADVHWLWLDWTYEGNITRYGRVDRIKAEKAVMGDQSRVNRIAHEAVEGVKAGRRVLIMATMREHITKLAEAVAALGVEPGLFVGGETCMTKAVTCSSYAKAAKGVDFKPPQTLFIPAGPVRDIRQAVGRALQPQVPHKTMIVHPVDLEPGLVKWTEACAQYYAECGFVFRNSLPGRSRVA